MTQRARDLYRKFQWRPLVAGSRPDQDACSFDMSPTCHRAARHPKQPWAISRATHNGPEHAKLLRLLIRLTVIGHRCASRSPRAQEVMKTQGRQTLEVGRELARLSLLRSRVKILILAPSATPWQTDGPTNRILVAWLLGSCGLVGGLRGRGGAASTNPSSSS